MNKLCTSCGGVMNYDPYFSANVCEKCGQMEKIPTKPVKIERTRWVIMRKGRTEIFCGLARDYSFKKVSEIGNTVVKTYSSEKKAISGFKNIWHHIDFGMRRWKSGKFTKRCDENTKILANNPRIITKT